MVEFQIGERKFRAQKLDAFAQLHVSRRIAPVLLGMVGVLEGTKTLEKTVEPIVRALADMSDQDIEYVVAKCLSVVATETNPGSWSAVWRGQALMFDDIDLAAMLQIVARVIQDSMSNFMDALPALTQSIKAPGA